ncbi:MAG: hypothetical protein ACRC0J_20760 [Shewanella oncorhynchi]
MEDFDLRGLLNPEHWLAMDCGGRWSLFDRKPAKGGWCWLKIRGNSEVLSDLFFNMPVCENWEDSLIQVKDLIKD